MSAAVAVGNVHYLSARVCLVANCGRPTDLYACWRCVEMLGDDLDDVADLVAELDVTLSRQARLGDRGPRRGSETPLPYDQASSDALWSLANVLGVWAVHVAGKPPGTRHPNVAVPGVGPGPAGVAVFASRWLAQRLTDLRRCPEVGEAYDELRDAIRTARRAINRSPSLAYAGSCATCATAGRTTHLYAQANDEGEPIRDEVTCRTCGAEWSYAATRAAMEQDARDRTGTAAEIARAMPVLCGHEVTVARLWQWAKRGKLDACGFTSRGYPLYRIGDVRDLLELGGLTPSGNGCQDRLQVDRE